MCKAASLYLAAWFAATLHAQPSVLTWHNDNARTGQNLQETTLTPANVNAASFQKLFVINVDGKVDAQPLYVPGLSIPGSGVHNVLYVVTEHDSAYAFDADSGSQLWHVSLLGSGETTSDDRGCGQVTPEIGVTSTPAIDLQSGPHGTMYAIAMSKNGSGTYFQRVHALDLTTGGEEFGGPVNVQATVRGSGAEGKSGVVTFEPQQHKERAALVILNGVVYTSWSSHCDIAPYTGWVIGYSEATLAQVSVLNLTPNGSDGGIWGSGAGPGVDASGNLYLLMGNGTFDTALTAGGFPVSGDYGNAFMKLSTGRRPGRRRLFYDVEYHLGIRRRRRSGVWWIAGVASAKRCTGSVAELGCGSGEGPEDLCGGSVTISASSWGADSIYQEMPSSLSGSVYSSPAWFNNTLYYGASGDALKAFSFANGKFGTTPISQSAATFGYPGTTPSISANGTANGIVWIAENANTAVLHAFDASNLSKELYNSNQAANGRDNFGEGNKYVTPTVVNGKVYVPTTSGVGVFGPTHPAFFSGETPLSDGVYYLSFFGYYNYQFFPFLYQYDLGFEYFVAANDSSHGAFLFDVTMGHWFYTSPSLFPFLYDFTLKAWLYYFPDTNNPGHFTSNPRVFENLSTNQVIYD